MFNGKTEFRTEEVYNEFLDKINEILKSENFKSNDLYGVCENFTAFVDAVSKYKISSEKKVK